MPEELTQLFQYSDSSLFVVSTYNYWMVLLSVFIAVLASFMGLQVAAQATNANYLRKHLLLCIGSIALGCGVWSMHFIGMLALKLCTDISFQLTPTLLSIFPAVISSWISLNLITQKKIKWSQLILGGVLVGTGIGTMHYVGMAAMEMAPLLRYNLTMFCVSILVAITLAILALWIRFGLEENKVFYLTCNQKTLLASVTMGTAILGMHYTGMMAARFVLPPGMELSHQTNQISLVLATTVTVITVTIILLVLGANLIFKYKDISAIASNNEQRLIATMNTAIDGIITIDSKGIITDINHAVTRLLGWESNELIGFNVNKVVPTPHHENHDQYIKNYLTSREPKIIGSGQEVDVITRQGEAIPVRLGVGHAEFNNKHMFVAFISDLRERKKMEDELKDSESKIRSLLTNIPGIAYRCLDKPGWPKIFINDEVENIIGYPAEDFLLPNPKRSLSEFVHPDDLEGILAVDLRHPDGYKLEFRMIDKDQKVKWVMGHGRATQIDNTQEYYLDGFIMDITDRKVIENALVEQKDKAEKAAATRSAFLANMSHEIRTPMNAIIGFSDILLDEELLHSQRKKINTINQSAKSLLHILNDILDSAKLDKGKFQIEYRDFSLIEEVDSVVSTLWLSAETKGLEIELNIEKQVQSFYNGAPDRIRQVLTNLIGNAIKFTEQGKVTIAIHKQSLNSLTFTITDTGIGMTLKQLETIFDAFAQADESMSRRFGGTGLGTTISKQLVELMGGVISAKSTVGKGSEFEFTIPLTQVKSSAQDIQKDFTALPMLNVLVVDDIEQNIELLTLLLKRNNHNVFSAINGEQALTKMANEDIDIVLMDIQMPVMDGLTAAKLRREYEQQKNLPKLPIIALTASVLPQDQYSAEQAGMNGFANKPIDFKKLMGEIARTLNMSKIVPNKDYSNVTNKVVEELNIDLQKGIELWGSKTRLYSEVSLLTSKLPKIIKNIEAIIEAKHWDKLHELAHTYKGISGNLGLNRFMKIFSHLEDAALHSDKDKALMTFVDIEPSLIAINCEIFNSNVTPSDPINKVIENNISEEDSNLKLLDLLYVVKDHVSNNEFDEPLLDKLQTFKGIYHQDVNIIVNQCNNFDFELAYKEINKLIDRLKSDT